MFKPRPNRRDRLHRFAQTFEEDRSQRLVAFADCDDAFLQDVKIEPPRQMHHIDDVILVSDLIEAAQDVNSLLLE